MTCAFSFLLFALESRNLGDNVLEGVVQPLVKGDGAVGIGVHGGEVLLPLGQAGLKRVGKNT